MTLAEAVRPPLPLTAGGAGVWWRVGRAGVQCLRGDHLVTGTELAWILNYFSVEILLHLVDGPELLRAGTDELPQFGSPVDDRRRVLGHLGVVSQPDDDLAQ
jgi:hypothetical protein